MLGKGTLPPDGVSREKATTKLFKGEGPISIEDAYNDLPPNAFSVWIRLLDATSEQLRSGRKPLAKMLRRETGGVNKILRRLRRRGYVTWLTAPGKRMRLVILRRALVKRAHSFSRAL